MHRFIFKFEKVFRFLYGSVFRIRNVSNDLTHCVIFNIIMSNRISQFCIYIGDSPLQKTYTTDFLTKKSIKNNGIVPQYYVEGDHEANIPKVIDKRLSKLQKELLKKVNQQDDYDAISHEILHLRDQRRQSEVNTIIKDEQMKQIRELQDFVKKQPSTITEFDETLVSRLIEKITVFEDYFTVNFKSGVTIDIEA